MTDLIAHLLQLQNLDFDQTGVASESQKAELRKVIPQPVLAHYDRLFARGKKGLSAVRNQVCSGCHMRLPIGTINTLMQNVDIQLCETCGRYLYLPEDSAPPTAEAVITVNRDVKPARKPRKRKAPAQAAV